MGGWGGGDKKLSLEWVDGSKAQGSRNYTRIPETTPALPGGWELGFLGLSPLWGQGRVDLGLQDSGGVGSWSCLGS